ncbi:hypothetical protein R5R73_11645 [Salinicola sp. LHM]|uniref:hypothetical protein n=1 Tax=Salinicola sp. LHM TaxID=3065298 RepID=UPI002ACD404A|nr:hypothetical protein [Salinicola sp. LHM]MEC8918733.1 hypothetical protein [Pseudomonadota bacterium]WQH31715.1 hypothetical protein R5R73_11645 [Salinicola sp. LHM]
MLEMTHVPIEGIEDAPHEIPTDEPESDGTLAWDSTGMVLVELGAGGRTGLGYTHGSLGYRPIPLQTAYRYRYRHSKTAVALGLV